MITTLASAFNGQLALYAITVDSVSTFGSIADKGIEALLGSFDSFGWCPGGFRPNNA